MKEKLIIDNEILEMNRRRIAREREREIAIKKEIIRKNEIRNRIDEVLTIFIAIAIIVLLFIAYNHFFGGETRTNAIGNCMNTGMSESWCVSHYE